MKRFLAIIMAATLLLPVMAQEERLRIAVFDPAESATDLDEGQISAIREIISSAVVNTGRHDVVERSLLEKVMEEQKFSQSGAVDNSQITEIGKLAGANKVIVTLISGTERKSEKGILGGILDSKPKVVVSIKMLDVQTASVVGQKVKTVTSNKLLEVLEPMATELILGKAKKVEAEQAAAPKPAAPKPAPVKKSKKQQVIGELQFNFPEHDVEAFLRQEPKLRGKRLDKFIEKNRNWYESVQVSIELDGVMIGCGSFRNGFSFKTRDLKPGKHKLKVSTPGNQLKDIEFKINTLISHSFDLDLMWEKEPVFKIVRSE